MTTLDNPAHVCYNNSTMNINVGGVGGDTLTTLKLDSPGLRVRTTEENSSNQVRILAHVSTSLAGFVRLFKKDQIDTTSAYHRGCNPIAG